MMQSFPIESETLSHPAYPGTVWGLRPRLSGIHKITRSAKPINIAYKVHGKGPVKLVLLIGLAGTQASWQQQTLYFGHVNESRYSVLTLDNRGTGDSSVPLTRYSTSEMAQDVLELLDFLSWTSPRSVNVVGSSLGGMIAQELALLVPERICTLSLIGTACEMVNTGGFAERLSRISMMVPRSNDVAILETAKQLFPLDWLSAEDDCVLPDPDTHPQVDPPPNGRQYGRFNSRYQRFHAQELNKKLSPRYNKMGFLLQMAAAGFHKKTPAQMQELGDKVGRKRILVFHGMDDKMISPVLGTALIEALKPGKAVVEEGMGHIPMIERPQWFNKMLENHIGYGEELTAQGLAG